MLEPGLGVAFCFQPEIIPEKLRVHSAGRGWEIALNYWKSTVKTCKVYSMLLRVKVRMMGQMAGFLLGVALRLIMLIEREGLRWLE